MQRGHQPLSESRQPNKRFRLNPRRAKILGIRRLNQLSVSLFMSTVVPWDNELLMQADDEDDHAVGKHAGGGGGGGWIIGNNLLARFVVNNVDSNYANTID